MKNQMVCIVYVDDTILAGPDKAALNNEIKGLGVSTDKQVHSFGLQDEEEVGDFLGIRIEKIGDSKFHLTQIGLINKVLETTNMTDCNLCPTPASVVPLRSDTTGEQFKESWNYATVIGMLMYLSGNSRPDIAFAVHQCARFTHAPHQSHAKAIKFILQYLQSTKEKRIIFNPSKYMQVDCYVDADFAGLWNVKNDQDPISVKSCTR